MQLNYQKLGAKNHLHNRELFASNFWPGTAPGRPTKNGPIVRKAVKAQFSFRCMTNITRLNTSINTATAAAV